MHRDRRIMAVLVLAIASGCGRALPETAPVEGRVTIAGQPLKTGTIMFFPTQGRPAIGVIDPDGVYRLTTFVENDGAVLGSHAVTIQADEVIGGVKPTSYADENIGVGAGELRHLVPINYGDRDTSGLTAQVVAQPEPNRIDFDLHK